MFDILKDEPCRFFRHMQGLAAYAFCKAPCAQRVIFLLSYTNSTATWHHGLMLSNCPPQVSHHGPLAASAPVKMAPT